MKECIKGGQLQNFGVEVLNSSFNVDRRFWFSELEYARRFKEACIGSGIAPAFVRIVKVID